MMVQLWAVLLIFCYLLPIGHAAPGEPLRVFPGGRPRKFARASSTAPITSSKILSTGASSSSTLANNYTGVPTGIPSDFSSNELATQNSTSFLSSVVPITTSSATFSLNNTAVPSSNYLSPASGNKVSGNYSNLNLGISSNAITSSLRINSSTNASIPMTSGPISTTSTIRTGLIPFASNRNGTSTVGIGAKSNITSAGILPSSMVGTNSSNISPFTATNSSGLQFPTRPSSKNLSSSSITISRNALSPITSNSSSITPSVSNSSNVLPSVTASSSLTATFFSNSSSIISSITANSSIITSSVSNSSGILPSITATPSGIKASVSNSSSIISSITANSSIITSSVLNSSGILPSITSTPSGIKASVSNSSSIISSVTANSSSITAAAASNSTNLPTAGSNTNSGNVSTSTSSNSPSNTGVSGNAANSSITGSTTSYTTTSSTGSSVSSSASSSTTGGGSSGGSGGGGGGGSDGLGLGGPGPLGGPGGGPGDGNGGDDGGDDNKKPTISNPTGSNSQPSQTTTSTSSSSTTSSNSITSTNASSSSISSSSTTSSLMNSTSVVSTSTMSNTTVSSSTTSSLMNSTSIASTSTLSNTTISSPTTSSVINSTSIASTFTLSNSTISSPTTSSFMNSTSIVSTSTTSRSMNSSSTITSSATGAYCSVGACNGAQCNPSSVPASKRQMPSIEGRLPNPGDFWRRDLVERNESWTTEIGQQEDIWKRGYIPLLTDPDFANNINNFITEQITYPGAKPCPLPTLNPDSTAITVKFDSPPGDGNYFPSLQGLEGCTSVVIIGENGCWISHFWEVPWFFGFSSNPDAFTQNVITPLENGNGANMPSPFASGGQSSRIPELATGQNDFQPEIYIFTREDNGAITYPAQVNLIKQALTGPGRAFAGLSPTVTGYVRQEPDSRIAKGKVLVQYTNDQEDDEGNQLVCPQEAIYKLWFEENMVSQHTWPAIGDQLAVPNAKAKLRRSQQCKSNTTTSTLSGISPTPTASILAAPSYSTIEDEGPQTAPISYASLASAVSNPSFVTKIVPASAPTGLALVSSGSLFSGQYPASSAANGIILETLYPSATAVFRPAPTAHALTPDELY